MPIRFSRPRPYIIFILQLYALHLCLFFCCRVIHYFTNAPLNLAQVAASEKFSAFAEGLRFDTSVIAYLCFLPLLVFVIAAIVKNKNAANLSAFLLFIIPMQLCLLACSADIPYFRQFGSHIGRQAFLWNENPAFIFGLLSGSFSYWGYILLFALLSFLSLFFSVKFFRRFKNSDAVALPPRFSFFLTWLFIFGLTVLAARGRVAAKSPLHEGVAAVSQNGFINSLGLNPNFVLVHSLLRSEKTYVPPANIRDYISYTRNYLGIQGPYEESITRRIQGLHPKNYNVIVVIMESMCTFKMGLYNGKNLTPHLGKLIKQSVYFDNFFSSGIHTFNGLFSTMSGYPSWFDEHPLERYTKGPFRGLGVLLKEQGYKTCFFTSHDPQFDNMSGFFKYNGFDKIISEENMPHASVSELGVPDHVLFDKVIEEVNALPNGAPFLSVVMTSSDHGPWVVPDNIPFKPNGATKEENSTLYADWAIGEFMKKARTQRWYQNTMFIFLGDHGLSMGHTYEMPLSFHHVPLVVHQPAVLKPCTLSKAGYQPDITATVMGLLDRTYNNETFGIDLFKETHPFVAFTADDKSGCVNNEGFYYYKFRDMDYSKLRKYKSLDSTNYIRHGCKSMADSLDYGMKALLETARYFIRKAHYIN